MRDNNYPVVAGTHQNKMLARPLCVCVFLVAACLLALPRGRFLQTGSVTKIILVFQFSWEQNAAADATQKANQRVGWGCWCARSWVLARSVCVFLLLLRAFMKSFLTNRACKKRRKLKSRTDQVPVRDNNFPRFCKSASRHHFDPARNGGTR